MSLFKNILYFSCILDQIYGHDRQYADSAFTNFSSFQIRGKKSSFDKYKAHGNLKIIICKIKFIILLKVV